MEAKEDKEIEELREGLKKAQREKDDKEQRKIRKRLRARGHYQSVYKVINLRDVPVDFHRRVKMQAVAEDTTIRELILRIVGEYLDRHKGKGGQK